MAKKNASPQKPSPTPSVPPGEVSTPLPPQEVPTPAPPGRTTPVGAMVMVLASSMLGLWSSYRLTAHHLDVKYGEAATDAFCTINEKFDCTAIINSEFSEIKGVPVSLIGLVTYGVTAALGGAAFQQTRTGRGAMSYVFGLSILSVFFSAFLAFISYTRLGAFCPYCLSLYAVNLVMMAGAWWGVGGGLFTAVGRTFAAMAILPLLVGSAGGWAASLFVGNKWYQGQKERLVQETITRQEAERKKLEAQGFKFPKVEKEDPFKGPADAKVTLIEFGDFECGYCKRLSYELSRVEEAYGDRVKFVFKNYPMNTACNPYVKNNRHAYACAAAVAGECAHSQGKFWEFHDIVYKNNHALKEDDLVHYAQQVGLDMDSWNQCRRDPETMAKIKRDMDEGKRLEINGTPRTYIEGEELKGVLPAEVLSQRLARALGEAEARIKRDKAELDTARAAVEDAPAQVATSVAGLSFQIDTFENTIDANGNAISAAGQTPSVRVSWYDAKVACEKVGKRLCTAEEWLVACAGARPIDNDNNGNIADDYVEGNEYPYGAAFRQGFCHVDANQDTGTVAPAGANPLCKSEQGVYDLTGNVAEWVGATEADAMLLGGGYFFEDKAKCQKEQASFGPGWAHRYSGFRCCQ